MKHRFIFNLVSKIKLINFNKMSANNFKSIVASKIKGGSPESQAANVQTKAIASFESQIAQLNSVLVDNKMAVSDAKQKLENAVYVTEIKSSNNYLMGIREAYSNLLETQEILKTTEDTIAFYTEQLNVVKN